MRAPDILQFHEKAQDPLIFLSVRVHLLEDVEHRLGRFRRLEMDEQTYHLQGFPFFRLQIAQEVLEETLRP